MSGAISDLAVLLRTMEPVLYEAGISANVIAGYHHDHILVPWEKRFAALEALRALSRHG